MLTCANCAVFACRTNELEKMQKNCPMSQSEKYADLIPEYQKPEYAEFFKQCALIEKDGYCEWNRMREIIELCKRMNYKKIGLAFCVGFKNEAKIFCDIMRFFDINVDSICCKNGAYDKTQFGVPEDSKLKPGKFEPCCNPIAQAKFLADEDVELFVVMGLCVGHDSMFFRYVAKFSDAPVTVFAVKDRATGHNPCAALYLADGYFRKQFDDEKVYTKNKK